MIAVVQPTSEGTEHKNSSSERRGKTVLHVRDAPSENASDATRGLVRPGRNYIRRRRVTFMPNTPGEREEQRRQAERPTQLAAIKQIQQVRRRIAAVEDDAEVLGVGRRGVLVCGRQVDKAVVVEVRRDNACRSGAGV